MLSTRTPYESVLDSAECSYILRDYPPCCAGADIRYPGDVAMCTHCGQWHSYEYGPISSAFAAELAREPVPVDQLIAAHAQIAESMSNY